MLSTPPFGAITIPPVRPVPRVHPPYLSQGYYVNERLGLQVPLPPGFTARLDSEGLLIQSQGVAFASLDLADWVVNAQTTNLMFDEIAKSVAKAMHGHRLVYAGGGAVNTPLGRAAERRWAIVHGEGRYSGFDAALTSGAAISRRTPPLPTPHSGGGEPSGALTDTACRSRSDRSSACP